MFGYIALASAATASAFLLRNSGDSTGASPYRQQLVNFANTQYYGKVTVGGQTTLAIMDSGSFEILITSSDCEVCTNKAFDSGKSKSFEKEGTVVKHSFGSGPTVSRMGYDIVKVGPLEAKHQAFWEIIDHRIPVLNSAKFAAIVGIGHGHPPQNDEKTLLMNYGVQRFSICLESASNSPGWLTWGPIAKPQHVTIPVVGEVHWGVTMGSVSFFGDNGKAETCDECLCHDTNGGCGAIIDSGTSLITLPSLYIEKLEPLLSAIKEDCSNFDSLPMMEFRLGEHLFRLPPSAYVMKVEEDLAAASSSSVWEKLFASPKIDGAAPSHACIPAFMRLDKMSQFGPVIILGMPFLRHYVVEFDRSAKEINVMRAGESCQAEPFGGSNEAGVSLLQKGPNDKPIAVSNVSSVLQPWEDEGKEWKF